MKTPRYYQEDALKALRGALKDDKDCAPLAVLATGTGKALICAELFKHYVQNYPSTRMMCLVDTKELVKQNHDTLLEQWPSAPVGIYSAGLKRKEPKAQILFAGIQSAYSKAYQIGKIDILLIDECHMIGQKDGTRYQEMITALKVINPRMRVVGLTATPYRNDSGLLHTGDDRIFTDIVYEYTIKQGVADGFLSEITSKATTTELNVDGVGKRGGEFIESQLQKAVNVKDKNEAAIDEIITKGQARKKWLVFSSGVDHAKELARIMTERGVKCAVVLGTTPDTERDQIIKDFKAGLYRCLINNAVLTKGFDAPDIDLIAMLRPTMSPVLWLQMTGRGLRIADGKINCLLLDFAGNVKRFGYIDDIKFKDKGDKGDGVPPMKECPECQEILYAGVRICPSCDHEFPAPEPEVDRKAFDGAVMSHQTDNRWLDVKDVVYSRHHNSKKDSTTMKVTYLTSNMDSYNQYVCFEHSGYARSKAIQWWNLNVDKKDIVSEEHFLANPDVYNVGKVPSTIEHALEFMPLFIKPCRIFVALAGKYPEILDYDFSAPLQSQELPNDDDFDISALF